MRTSQPRYVRTADGTYIAYLVVGDGPVDIAWQLDYVGNLDCIWDSPFEAAWCEALASLGRVILHDRRATGLSSRNVDPPNLETRVADLRAVLDEVGSHSTVIGGYYESLAPGVLLAATEPERVRSLVWWNPGTRTAWAPDYPWGSTPEEMEADLRGLLQWGTLEYGQAWADSFAALDGVRPAEDEILAMAKMSRNTCTPDVAVEMTRTWWETDLGGVLPSVPVPTLLLAESPGPRHIARAQYVASLMPAAEVVEVPGEWPTAETMQSYIQVPREAVRRFVGLQPTRRGLDSVLATVLFTDIVDATPRQAALGDQAWKELVEAHHTLVRELLTHWRGHEHDTAGDGFFASFDGPARAIRCALEIAEQVRDLGLEIRAGIHTGECEVIDRKVGGIAVSIGSRISTLAGSSQVLISQTVKDLVAGSGLTFADAGEHELRGVPDRWHLYAAVG